MSRGEKLPLKAFWEAVEQRLAACSAEELRAILRAMAQETLPSERQAFLDTIAAGSSNRRSWPGGGWPGGVVSGHCGPGG